MSRYANIEFILNAPFYIGMNHINKAWEQERDKKIWEMWLAVYPHMSEETFVNYYDFKDKILNGKPKKEQTPKEMMTMVQILNAAFGGKVVEA